MELLYYLITALIVASACSGYLMVRAKNIEKDFRKTQNFMCITVLLTFIWMVLVVFS